MKRLIRLFMWGYQHAFRGSLRFRAEQVFEELGVHLKPDVFLVGALKPAEENPNPVCVEPEEEKWSPSLFTGLLESIEATVKTHPLQRMIYGDEPSMRDKPENTRRSSVTIAVRDALKAYDCSNGVRSFCGAARPVGSYYVVPVIQVPGSLFQQFSPLELPATDDAYFPHGEQSLIHSSIAVLLKEASKELLTPEPGRSVFSDMRSASEIVVEAADHFMQIPDLLTGDRASGTDLFQRLNIISSLFYEGMKGLGSLVLVRPDNPAVDYLLRFQEPVPFRHPRWARKVLQMATPNIALIASSGKIYGLGKLKDTHDPTVLDAFTINFLDHYQWELCCGARTLMYSRYREPRLPQEPISQAYFCSNFLRLFSGASKEHAEHLWKLFITAADQRHGSMLVIAEDAESEAARLCDQGTPIRPVQMTPELLERVSGIDGSVIVDPKGVCHAVGVILDGEAAPNCSPSRGSRFNSALRYVRSNISHRLAIVVSDDRTIDIIPLLRPQIKKNEVDRRIAELEMATLENYHGARLWLDEHRFYVTQEQCPRVNRALDRIEKLPREVGQLVILTRRFEPDPELNDTFFLEDKLVTDPT